MKPDQHPGTSGTTPTVAGDNPVLSTGIAVVTNGQITRANENFCRLAGYRREELLGQPLRMLFATEDDFAHTPLSDSANSRPQMWTAFETRWRGKDGAFRHILIEPGLNPETPAGAGEMLIARDLTDAQRARDELLQRNRQLAAFHRVSEIMLADHGGQPDFDSIAREAGKMAGFPLVAIELCDFERAVMMFRGVYGIDLEGLPAPLEVPMDVTLSGHVAFTGEVLVETNAMARREHAAPILRKLGVQTFLAVPIKTNGKVIGVLSMGHRDQIQIEPRVVLTVTSLANYLATLFDRLQARDTARRGEAELFAVYDRAPNAMCLFDERLRIVRANRAAAEFAGSTQEQLLKMRATDFFKCLAHPHGCIEAGVVPTCSDCDLRRAVAETLATGKSWHQVRINRVRKLPTATEEAVLLVSTERIQVDGMLRVLVCLDDITQSVRADEQIRSQAALLEITRDAIYVRDFCDRILYWSEGSHRLYGWALAEARGLTVAELGLNTDPSESARALQAIQQNEEWFGEMRQRTREGRDLIVQSRWTLVRESDGTPKAILIVNTDITERKRLESQLLRAQRLESIGTLASGLAHDLNNVLAPLMMAVGMLREQTRDAQSRTYLDMLDKCAQRGADIVRQVLTFARGVEGAKVLVDPKHLINDMVRIARETFPRSIEIDCRLTNTGWGILGDATQIQQVLMNLCVNARDAMPDGGTLTLRLDRIELDRTAVHIHPKAKVGPYLVLGVTDTGTGITPELMEKIFDPFFTTKPLGQGTGLGLPSVLGIAESHGGFVHVETQPGKGSTFNVYLPATTNSDLGGAADSERAIIPKGSGDLILVVDDEPAVRRIAHALLVASGYRTLLAAEGNEALALFEKHSAEIKIVISDLMMPRMDGPTTIRALRKLSPAIKIIAITGLGEESRVAEVRAAGTDLVLHKPFTSAQLLGAIQQLLATE